MITKADIAQRNTPVIVKWDKPLTNNGAVTEGVIAGQATEFIPRIEAESRLLGRLRYVEMDGETQDIQALRVRPKLKNMDKISGASAGAQLDDITTLTEVKPEILKSTLEAQAFTAYTKIPKTFMETNIEKENFVAKYESLLAPGCAFSAEQIAIFGKKTDATEDGLLALSGLLDQLDAVKTAYDSAKATNPKHPMGEFTTIHAGEGYDILSQLDAMLDQFTYQRGKRRLADFYVSSKMESKIIGALGVRETERGDKLVFDDEGNATYRGRKIIQLDALDDPENSYGDVIILMNSDSVGYGPVLEADSESQYYVHMKSYLTSVDWMFDVGIIFPEDVLYADVDYTAKE